MFIISSDKLLSSDLGAILCRTGWDAVGYPGKVKLAIIDRQNCQGHTTHYERITSITIAREGTPGHWPCEVSLMKVKFLHIKNDPFLK